MQWITALRSEAIGELVAQGHVQLGLFDERNLFELTHPDYPGERLVACRNPELAKSRGHTRQSLLAATQRELDVVRGMVKRGRLKGADAIGVRVGKVINKYKVASTSLSPSVRRRSVITSMRRRCSAKRRWTAFISFAQALPLTRCRQPTRSAATNN